jgi:3-hydroxyacyl-CoA dehydrogenase
MARWRGESRGDVCQWESDKAEEALKFGIIDRIIEGDLLVSSGGTGKKTGAGWYIYDEQRRAMPDPQVAELVQKWVREAGIAQRQIAASEITDRCIYALVNEGARILQEGYALCASDIDIIYLNGYGFPAHRCGPMWYADTVGLKRFTSESANCIASMEKPGSPRPYCGNSQNTARLSQISARKKARRRSHHFR